MEKDPFKEYLRESEPDKAHKGYAWSTAIGLQAVDGLKPSKYLIDTAIQNIEGKITMKEAQSLIDSYYEERPVYLSDDERTEEADKVSSRIAEILSETAFSFSPNEYISIHRKLFQGIYKHAGKIRDYKKMAEELEIGEPTLRDITAELEKPGRDPRDEMPKPILRSDVLAMEDLKEGMVLKGTVRNVIDFGAFVDIGVHQDGLVHVSEMSSKKFVKHPLDVVKVGDIIDVKVIGIDLKKKRISLSMKL